MAREGSRQAKPGVFLSYARTDHSLASQLAQGLEVRGLSVWWDAQIRVGDSWEQAIKRALLLADVVLVLVTPSSVESRWVTNEWSAALEQSQLVIPVVGGGLSLSDLPLPLAGIQGVEFDPDDPSGFDLLARAIRHALGSPDPAVERPAAVLDVDRIANMAAEQVLKQLRDGPLAQAPSESTGATLVFVVMSFAPDMEPTFEAIDAAAVSVGLRGTCKGRSRRLPNFGPDFAYDSFLKTGGRRPNPRAPKCVLRARVRPRDRKDGHYYS